MAKSGTRSKKKKKETKFVDRGVHKGLRLLLEMSPEDMQAVAHYLGADAALDAILRMPMNRHPSK